ncbi:MAG: tyrosine-type recombinase/integrase [Promethearchaeota archaeon]
MRISKLLALRRSDVNIKERKITIREKAKTGRGRVVYFSNNARDALKAWIEKRDCHKELLFYVHRRSTQSYPGARHLFN